MTFLPFHYIFHVADFLLRIRRMSLTVPTWVQCERMKAEMEKELEDWKTELEDIKLERETKTESEEVKETMEMKPLPPWMMKVPIKVGDMEIEDMKMERESKRKEVWTQCGLVSGHDKAIQTDPYGLVTKEGLFSTTEAGTNTKFVEVIKKLEEIKSNKNAESNTSMEIFPPTPSSAISDRNDSGKIVEKLLN